MEGVFAYNGRIFRGDDYDGLANCHLFYKGKSIIVDYEACLHPYASNFKDGKIVPVEVYPYQGDIAVLYITRDNKFEKVDLEELMPELDKLIDEENLNSVGQQPQRRGSGTHLGTLLKEKFKNLLKKLV